MKIRPVGAVLFHADRRKDERTDMTKLIVASRNFAKEPSNRMVHGEECRKKSSRPIAGAVPEFSGQTVSVEN
jgi:hypothetical protein